MDRQFRSQFVDREHFVVEEKLFCSSGRLLEPLGRQGATAGFKWTIALKWNSYQFGELSLRELAANSMVIKREHALTMPEVRGNVKRSAASMADDRGR